MLDFLQKKEFIDTLFLIELVLLQLKKIRGGILKKKLDLKVMKKGAKKLLGN